MDDDNQRCEFCPAVHPIEDMQMSGDCWLCPSCVKDAREAFEACDHKWRPEMDDWGDPAQLCERCCHIVRDVDFPPLGLKHPSSNIGKTDSAPLISESTP